jgi:virginiamycin B lyase
MKKISQIRPLVFIFLSLVFGMSLVDAAQAGRSAPAGLTTSETALNPAGEAYELNPDPQGILWISDYTAGEIWRVDPADGSHTVYPVGGGPSDARSDGAGNLWWVDAKFNQVGYLTTADNSVSLWDFTGAIALYGSGLGSSSDIWVTDTYANHLYHLSPTASEVCTYTLPSSGSSNYLVIDGSQGWLSDWVNSQVIRLETNGDTFNWWQLPAGSQPSGMALDGSGSLWWADSGRALLGYLVPATNQIITYTQSTVQAPQMLTLADGRVWYSDQGKVGVLDPARAAGTSSIRIPQSISAVKTCSTSPAPFTTKVAPTTGQASWTDVTYPSVSSPSGWQVFRLPLGSSAWGIAATADNIWLVDQGRQVLARLPKQTQTLVYLPFVTK